MELIEQFRTKLERKKGERDRLRADLAELKEKAVSIKSRLSDSLEAQDRIQTVASQTQSLLSDRISSLVNLAMEGVWGELAYKFQLSFVLRRGKTEADISFRTTDGKEIEPLKSSGGGYGDVVGFALRVALLYLCRDRFRSVLVLDEPFKFLGELRGKASEVIQEVSDSLGFQIIIVTHPPIFEEIQARTFRVKKQDDISVVMVEK